MVVRFDSMILSMASLCQSLDCPSSMVPARKSDGHGDVECRSTCGAVRMMVSFAIF